jgi:L-arabinose isomerase
MKVKHGPVTLLSVVETGEGRLKLLVAEGKSVPGPILQIGNTNSRYRFPRGIRHLLMAGAEKGRLTTAPSALAILPPNRQLGAILHLPVVRVC